MGLTGLFIDGIMIDWEGISPSSYLRDIDAFSGMESIPLKTPVTFFVGENGTGKSTLLEAMAVSWGFNPEGGTVNYNFSTYDSHSELGEHVTLSRGASRPSRAYFYRLHAGMSSGEMDLYSWFSVPSQALREAVSGKVYFDNYGEFTRIREMLKEMPQDVRLKKLAGHLFLMNQSGQYNYPRLIRRGDKAAAQLAAGEFVKSAMEAVFLINREYMPYYKWSFRALSDLPVMGEIGDTLYTILTGSNDGDDAEEKYLLMEKICSLTGEALTDMGLTRADCSDMQKHAFSVNDMIRDADIRNLGILYGV